MTLATTAVVVVAVNPLRVWLQRRVDRLMYGDRADPYAGLSRLAERLEASVTPQMALRTIVDTVADSLKVPFVAIDLVGADGRSGPPCDPGPAPAETRSGAADLPGRGRRRPWSSDSGPASSLRPPTTGCSTSWPATPAPSCTPPG